MLIDRDGPTAIVAEAASQRRMRLDSIPIPMRPANQNMTLARVELGGVDGEVVILRTAMPICCTCFVVYGSPGFTPNLSIQVLVIP